MSRKKPPDCGAAARNSPLAHRGNDLVQRQIRLLSNQSQQPFRVLLQRRSAASCRLCFGASGITPALQPFHRRTRAQIEALGGLPPRRSRFDCFDHAFPQIIGIWFWHRLGPQRTNQRRQIRPSTRPWESLRFKSAGTCSSVQIDAIICRGRSRSNQIKSHRCYRDQNAGSGAAIEAPAAITDGKEAPAAIINVRRRKAPKVLRVSTGSLRVRAGAYQNGRR